MDLAESIRDLERRIWAIKQRLEQRQRQMGANRPQAERLQAVLARDRTQLVGRAKQLRAE